MSTAPARRMPVLFLGHGSPMNAIQESPWKPHWIELGRALPLPNAILCVSAHWYIPGTALTSQAQPPTIHDFGGFPAALFAVQYPAPGDPGLAERVRALLGDAAQLREDWGLDHGAWSMLVHLYPDARIPVVQLSIDRRLAPGGWYDLGQQLMPLREEGILILGSGNIVHNLRDALPRLSDPEATTPAWAAECDAIVASALEAQDRPTLTGLLETALGRQGHPTPDHYAPLLYCAGAGGPDAITYPVTGFEAGSLSMRAVLWGA